MLPWLAAAPGQHAASWRMVLLAETCGPLPSDPPAGAFGLLPFMALWQPPREPPKVPADSADLQGWQNLMQARDQLVLCGLWRRCAFRCSMCRANCIHTSVNWLALGASLLQGMNATMPHTMRCTCHPRRRCRRRAWRAHWLRCCALGARPGVWRRQRWRGRSSGTPTSACWRRAGEAPAGMRVVWCDACSWSSGWRFVTARQPPTAPVVSPCRSFINVMTCDFLCLCALAPFW